MSSYRGFVVNDEPTDIRTWLWGSDQDVQPRFMKNVIFYYPMSSSAKHPNETKTLYVPDTVYPGPFYMKLDDVLARTGGNAADADAAKVALRNATSAWNSDFDAWLEDGSTTRIRHDQLNPNAQTSGSYKTATELAAMWSLVVRRIKDASARSFNINARFWEPSKLRYSYSIYFVPTSAVTVEQLQDALDNVLDELYPDWGVWLPIATSVPPSDTQKIGHNFFCLYDTYMTQRDYKLMLEVTYGNINPTSPTDPWPIRPWPSDYYAQTAQDLLGTKAPRKLRTTTTIKADTIKRRTKKAKIQRPSRTMNKVDVSVIEDMFWTKPKVPVERKIMPPYNTEWLLRANWTLGGSQRKPNIFFGTSECGTQILRAERSIKQFALASKWDCKLITTPSDAAQPHGTRWMWQFDTDKKKHSETPTFMSPRGGKPFSWAVAFLDYEFVAVDPKTKQSIHVLDRFDTFNRYIPLRLEVELDQRILDTYLSYFVLSASEKGLASFKHASAVADDPTTTPSLGLNPVAAASVPGSDEQTEALGMTMPYVQDPQIVAIVAQTFAGLNNTNKIPLRYKRTTTTLFGVPIEAKIFEFDNHSPPIDPVIYEQVELRTLGISQIFHDLGGTLFDILRITNVLFVYQNHPIDSTKGIGWSLECDVEITQNIGPLYHVAHTLFGTNKLSIHMTTNFGHNPSQTWDDPLETLSFTLAGALTLPSMDLVSNVRFHSFGVHLHAIRSHVDASKAAKLQYGWDIFGNMSVNIPHGTPTRFEYMLSEKDHIISVEGKLHEDVWRDAAGIRGLDLRSVAISMDFSSTGKPAALDIEVTADISLNDFLLEIEGSFSLTRLDLVVALPSFNIGELDLIYNLFYELKLDIPRVDLAVGSASLSISGGIPSLSFFDITVDGKFDIPTTQIKFCLSGVEFGGRWGGSLSIFDDFSVDDVEVMLSIARRGQGKFYLWFKADASWTILSQRLAFRVQVYIYKDHRGSKQYVISGGVSGGQAWTFGRIIGSACPNFLVNVGLKQLSLLIASQDQVDRGPIVTSYRIRQGVQICAEIGTIDQVNKVLEKGAAGSANSLILYARFPQLAFTIQLPAVFSLDFGRGVRTTPISLTLALKPRPALIVEAGISYQPNGRGTHLRFDLILVIETYQASATLLCTLNWNNPLGISQNLTIKEIQLGLSMVYASGHPNTIKLGGKLQVGHNTSEVLLMFGDNPADYLLDVTVHSLDINEIIRLASTILGGSNILPTLPNGTIYCRFFHLYACLSGVRSAGRYYPPGFSAHLDLRIFGVNAYAKIDIQTSSGFYGSASIQNFKFGIIWVEDAHLGISWTRSHRSMSAGGRFKVWYWWFGWKYFWVNISVSIGPGGVRSLTDPNPSDVQSLELSEVIYDSSPETQIDVVLDFLVLAHHKLPLSMQRNIPPTDWQHPMAEGEGVIYTFHAAFDENLLSAVSALLRRHLEALHPSTAVAANAHFSAVFSSLSEELSLPDHSAPTEGDLIRHYQEVYETAENARTARHEQLNAEFIVFRETLDALAAQHKAAREHYQSFIQTLENGHAELVAQHEEVPLRTERRRKEAEEALREAAEELFLQENLLRGSVGDLPAELERIRSSISAITHEVHMMETALQRLSLSQLPRREAMRQCLETALASLKDQLFSFESTRAVMLQHQREIAENDTIPIYQAVRLAKAKLAQAQEAVQTISSRGEAEAAALLVAITEAAERVQQAQTEGPAYQALADVQQAIDDHIVSKSPYFTDQGLLIDLDRLPEASVCEDAREKLHLALNAAADRANLERTKEFFNSLSSEDRARAEDTLHSLIQAFPQNPPHLEHIIVDGSIESGKKFEELMLDADILADIGGREIELEWEFPVTECHNMANNLVREILRKIFE